jgi:hypothetical protein
MPPLCLNVPMNRVLIRAALTVLGAGRPAQFPRVAPPPPCRAKVAAPALLIDECGGSSSRPKVAVSRCSRYRRCRAGYLAVALPDRFASDWRGSSLSRQIRRSIRMISAPWQSTKEVEVVLHRRGQPVPTWRASFPATNRYGPLKKLSCVVCPPWSAGGSADAQRVAND